MGNTATKKSKRREEGKEKKKKEDKKKSRGSSKRGYAWERKLLQKQLYSTGLITHAVIADLNDGSIMAVQPATFVPDELGLHDVVDALKGKLDGLEERGVSLRGGTGVYTPAKMDDNGKIIYCTDGNTGGCVIHSTESCILIVVYNSHAEAAMQAAAAAASYMIKNGR